MLFQLIVPARQNFYIDVIEFRKLKPGDIFKSKSELSRKIFKPTKGDAISPSMLRTMNTMIPDIFDIESVLGLNSISLIQVPPDEQIVYRINRDKYHYGGPRDILLDDIFFYKFQSKDILYFTRWQLIKYILEDGNLFFRECLNNIYMLNKVEKGFGSTEEKRLYDIFFRTNRIRKPKLFLQIVNNIVNTLYKVICKDKIVSYCKQRNITVTTVFFRDSKEVTNPIELNELYKYETQAINDDCNKHDTINFINTQYNKYHNINPNSKNYKPYYYSFKFVKTDKSQFIPIQLNHDIVVADARQLLKSMLIITCLKNILPECTNYSETRTVVNITQKFL